MHPKIVAILSCNGALTNIYILSFANVNFYYLETMKKLYWSSSRKFISQTSVSKNFLVLKQSFEIPCKIYYCIKDNNCKHSKIRLVNFFFPGKNNSYILYYHLQNIKCFRFPNFFLQIKSQCKIMWYLFMLIFCELEIEN